MLCCEGMRERRGYYSCCYLTWTRCGHVDESGRVWARPGGECLSAKTELLSYKPWYPIPGPDPDRYCAAQPRSRQCLRMRRLRRRLHAHDVKPITNEQFNVCECCHRQALHLIRVRDGSSGPRTPRHATPRHATAQHGPRYVLLRGRFVRVSHRCLIRLGSTVERSTFFAGARGLGFHTVTLKNMHCVLD